MLINKYFLSNSKKKALVLLGVLILLITAVALSPQGRNAINEYKEDALLAKLIETSGAEFHAINVTGWVRINDDVANSGSLETLCTGFADQMGLSRAGREMQSWQNSVASGARLEAKTLDGQVVSIMAQALKQPGGKTVSHLMVSCDAKGRKEARSYKQRLHNALISYGRDTRVAMTCSGKINGALDGDEMLLRAEKMMSKAGAPIEEQTLGENLVSLTGFSPRLAGSMNYAGREVNLNVALRRSTIDGATYVYAASPVILTEY